MMMRNLMLWESLRLVFIGEFKVSIYGRSLTKSIKTSMISVRHLSWREEKMMTTKNLMLWESLRLVFMGEFKVIIYARV